MAKSLRIGAFGFAAMLLSGAVAGSESREDPPEPARSAIRRALPYLARQTGAWIEQKKCTSCHQVPHALWAMNEAGRRGFSVDSRLAEWNRWSVNFVLRDTDQTEELDALARERADELYQLLLSGSTADVDSGSAAGDGTTHVHQNLATLLSRGRHEDGYWHANGQLPDQKRPLQENHEVTTMWSLLAADRAPGVGGAAASQKLEKPEVAARSASIEHLVLRYLHAAEDGSPEQAETLRSRILSAQNTDGGWGWLLKDPSDALATGQVLYALSSMAPKHRRDAVRRAHRFLVETQEPDGSWLVPSTLERNNGQPSVVSNDWGTAWAVIGLTTTLPP